LVETTDNAKSIIRKSLVSAKLIWWTKKPTLV
jgi:hypothetical protein